MENGGDETGGEGGEGGDEEGRGRGGEGRGGEWRGEEAFLVMWPRRLSALYPPLVRHAHVGRLRTARRSLDIPDKWI